MQKKIFRIIVELILGSIMLFICYSYVTLHSAERTNFISGMDVLKQKVIMWFDDIVGKGNAQQAQAQQSMIRNYKEINSYAQENNCNSDIQKKISTALEEISNISPHNYAQKDHYYNNQASILYSTVKECSAK